MPHDNFWLSVKAIAAFLDADRRGSDEIVSLLEDDLRNLNVDERSKASEDLTIIIGQLARLKMRMLNIEN